MDLAGIIVAVIDGYSLDWAIRGAESISNILCCRSLERKPIEI